jgi:signal transduction histidine kinase
MRTHTDKTPPRLIDSATGQGEAISPAQGVRFRVLVPLTLAIVLLMGAVVGMFVRHANHRRVEDDARAAYLVEDLLRSQLSENVQVMSSIMPLIMRDELLAAALRAGDRQTLLEISEPILQDLRAANRITHFYFILPDRTMLLRVQHPEEWGDRIDRFVLQEAQRTGRPFWGNEQGPFGSFTLRVVHPWNRAGELIGYFELGIEFEDVMPSIHELLDVDVFVAIDKKFLDRPKWDSMQKKLGRSVRWDEFPSVIVLSRTSQIPAPIASYLAVLQPPHIKHTFETRWDDRVAQAIVMPFADLRGEVRGELLVLRDITIAAAEARRVIIWLMAACTAVGGSLVVMFYFLLGRVQRDVAERSSLLAKSQERVRERTVELLYANTQLTEEIAERKEAQREAEMARERIDAILEAIPDGLIVTDLNDLVILMNQASQASLDLTEASRQPIESLAEDLRRQIVSVRQGDTEELVTELARQTAGIGPARVLQAHTMAMRSAEGRLAGTITLLHDVTREREVDRMKDEFISTAAHELRTPLTTVTGYLQLLLLDEQAFAPEERKEFLTLVYDKAEELAQIINDLLDLSTVQAGRLITLKKSCEDLIALLGRAVAAYQGLSGRHTFSFEVQEPSMTLCFDPGKIGQVLENLLSNAVKFSPAGGTIRVTGERTDGEFQVTVADQGIGMKPEQVAHIFDKFYRADASATAVGGLGLGMNIVHNIIEAHGGRIWVESESGRGTRVHFTLKLEYRCPECAPPGRDRRLRS